MRTFDVVVLGGGPAGSAAGLELARADVAVAVMERTRYDAPRLGETLPPSAKPLLRRLGIWDAFEKDGHLPSPGTVSVWGDAQPYDNDFNFHPYGHGWHLDRARFDQTLAEAAEQAGATFYRSARVQSVHRTERGWLLRYESAGALYDLSAAFAIDATGRSAWLARQQGANRIVLDRLVGVIGFGECSGSADQRTILEATADGWWYAARLPNGKVVASFMTDVDLLPRGNDNLIRFWKDRLRSVPLTDALWSNPDDSGKMRVTFSGTVRLDRIGGPGWLAIGDAAVAFDPLSSQGIVKTLDSGLHGAAAIVELLKGNRHALTQYSQWLETEFATYKKNYAHYYNQVTRWPESRFWRRRQVARTSEIVYREVQKCL